MERRKAVTVADAEACISADHVAAALQLAAVACEARHAFLAALPIPAAVIGEADGGALAVLATNAPYAVLDRAGPEGPLMQRPELIARVASFLDAGEPACEGDWIDGDPLHGRHYTLRVARLAPLAPHRNRCLLSLIDRTAEIEMQRSLRAEMLHDSLTGLPNRAAFEEEVERALKDGEPGRAEGALAIVLVDLARFSRINESMGGVVGDELIITAARRLLGALRAADLLARTGGNEFAILMHVGGGEPDVLAAAARVEATLRAPFRLSDLEISVNCAIGAAIIGESGGASEDLFRNAQLALKRAKDSGRIALYQRGEVAAVRRRFSIETELRRAIEQDRLSLAWQPVVDLQRGGIASFEALARWHHPEQGHISPVEFIPVAEESALIVPLGRWALDKALRTLAAWDREIGRELPVSIAVNLSPIQIARDDVPEQVDRALDAHGIAGRRLTVEVTESAIIRDPERAMRFLRRLSNRQVTIAMDDFGTRLFEPRLSPEAADRPAQDRSQLRDADAGRSRFGGDRARGAEPRRIARHEDDGGGDRDLRAVADARRARLQLRAGLSLCPPARTRRRARLLALRQRLSDRGARDRLRPGEIRKALADPLPFDRRQRRRHDPARREPERDELRAGERQLRAVPSRQPVQRRRIRHAGEQQPVGRGNRAEHIGERAEALVRAAVRRRCQPLARRLRQPEPDRDRLGDQRVAWQQRGEPAQRIGGHGKPGLGGDQRGEAGPARLVDLRQHRPQDCMIDHQRDRRAGIGEGEQLGQLVRDPLARERHQIVCAPARRRRAPPDRARRTRTARGSGRSGGCADDPPRCAATDRR